jgi:tetratricopeptide (TPR) repeat protein
MFKEVITLAPDNFRGYSNLGGIYVAMGQYQNAISALEKSVSIRPTGYAYLNLGTAYFSQRNFERAASNYEQGLKLGENEWLSWGNFGDACYQLAGKREQAMDAYKKAIELADVVDLKVNPRDGLTWAYRATYLAMLDRKDEALTSLQKAISFSPQDPDVRLRAALVYNHFGDTNRTFEWLQKARAAGTSASLIRGTPDFDHLSGDPRLQALLR